MMRRLFLFLIVILLVVGCKREKKSLFSVQENQVVPVKVFKVKVKDAIPISIEYPGKTKSSKKVTVVARITGKLEKILFKEGSYVKKGTPLFLIERDIYEARVKSAEANVKQAKAKLFQAERTWKRIEHAFRQGAVSKEKRDQAYAQYKAALAYLELAKAQLKEAKIFLSYTKITAPISGIISEKRVSEGNVVKPGTPLAQINRLNPIYVYFSIPDSDIYKYHFTSPTSPNYLKKLTLWLKVNNQILSRKGKVDYISPILDPATSTLSVRAVFPNPARKIPANLFVRVKLCNVIQKGGALIPKSSVLYSPKGPQVFLITNNTAKKKAIFILGEWGNFYVVKGLKKGSLVAISNLMHLRTGSSVKIIQIVNQR